MTPDLGRALSTLKCPDCRTQIAATGTDGKCDNPVHRLEDPTPFIRLAHQAAPTQGAAQAAMRSALVSAIYERYWRPAVTRLSGGRGYDDELQLLRRHLPNDPGATLFDLCCGTGYHLRQLDNQCLVIGIDSSESMLKRAALQASRSGQRRVFVLADVESIEGSEPTDGVVCMGAIHLLAEPLSFLERIRHLVKQEAPLVGLVICASPQKAQSRNRLGLHLLTPDQYSSGLRRAGFEVAEFQLSGNVLTFAAYAR